jgi:hypothetical protein
MGVPQGRGGGEVIANINIRVLGNGYLLVQYQEDGKAKDAGFADWGAFINWISVVLSIETITRIQPAGRELP